MKRTILVAAFIITSLSTCVLGQTPNKKSGKDEKAKNEVIALAETYFKASVEMDAAVMERILADDYVSIDTNDSVCDDTASISGFPYHKDSLIIGIKGGSRDGPRLAAIEMDENIKEVRVFGETAVLTTKITLKWQGSREELARKYKFMPRKDDFIVTLMAIKKNGVWQIISTHQSHFKLKAQESKPLPKN